LETKNRSVLERLNIMHMFVDIATGRNSIKQIFLLISITWQENEKLAGL
jgi:hypothetical protein